MHINKKDKGTMTTKIEKHLDLTFRFTVTIDESGIPTEGVNSKTWCPRSGDDAAWREADELNRRLLLAVLTDEKTLNNCIRHEIATWFELDDHWESRLLEGIEAEGRFVEQEDILASVITTLSKEDQDHFAEAKANQVFYESVDAFVNCFSTELENLKIVYVKG